MCFAWKEASSPFLCMIPNILVSLFKLKCTYVSLPCVDKYLIVPYAPDLCCTLSPIFGFLVPKKPYFAVGVILGIYLSVSKHSGQVSCASILGEVNPQVSQVLGDRLSCFITLFACSMKCSLLSAVPWYSGYWRQAQISCGAVKYLSESIR